MSKAYNNKNNNNNNNNNDNNLSELPWSFLYCHVIKHNNTRSILCSLNGIRWSKDITKKPEKDDL